MLTKEMMLGVHFSRGQSDMLDSQRRPPKPTVNTTRNLLNFFMSLRSGSVNNVRVRLGRLHEMINTACIESLDFLASGLGGVAEWHDVLKGQVPWTSESRRLYLSENVTTATSATVGRERKRTTRRKLSHDPSKSPLLTSQIYTEDPASSYLDSTFSLSESPPPSAHESFTPMDPRSPISSHEGAADHRTSTPISTEGMLEGTEGSTRLYTLGIPDPTLSPAE